MSDTPHIYPARGPIGWFLRNTRFAGICLPPWGIYIEPAHIGNDTLRRHELVHWAQWQRMGTLRYYTTYLWQLVRYGYRNAPMEREARGET